MQKQLYHIIAALGGTLAGQDIAISRIAPLHTAQKDDISFVSHPKHLPEALASQAGALIVHHKLADKLPGHDLQLGLGRRSQFGRVRGEGDITGLRATKRPATLTNVHKILVMGDAPVIRALQERLKPQFPHLEIHRSKDEYLEIVNRAATKAQAIQFMENRLGVSADEVIAFGDNYNDRDMLRYAGYSVAMGNAPDDIKAECSTVTAPNDEDGLAQVLEQLFPA